MISHQKDWRWQSPSLETQLLFKKCLSESLNNSQLCSEEKPSCIGTPVKVWTRWNSQKLNQTWTISFLNINNIKMPQPKKKENSTRRRHDLLLSYNLHKLFLYKVHIFIAYSSNNLVLGLAIDWIQNNMIVFKAKQITNYLLII